MNPLTMARAGTGPVNDHVVVDLYYPFPETEDNETDLVYRETRMIAGVRASISAPAVTTEGSKDTPQGVRSSTVDLLTLSSAIRLVKRMLVDETCRGGEWIPKFERRVFTIDRFDRVGSHIECRLEPAQRGQIQ